MNPYRAAVLTVSDSSAEGRRQDTSGPLLAGLLSELGFVVTSQTVVPDERSQIADVLRQHVEAGVAVVATTGGTGLGPRDVTPEATRDVIEREIPGIAEAMRAETLQKTPFAMTSRQVAGSAGRTLIVNFPGSAKAVEECFAVVRPVLKHVVDLLMGHTEHRH
ncbi:molybdenum cofactor biosynthesis protein [Alicyclobacillus hesperidum]|uniref:Molybdenum cofactor biosynthesis protein n=1 Tax=Alicyclobacillus hesperidum TaxID=89784 RepID=A0A1H2WGL6_9BACL|nr:MogA/MoaB family molybdenum cofactor biosynthesis protein [Alicyclobacillus hesperidum]GLV13066.1 molybdenum cofactor biosynthesis protein [Alicyclobacillus hesperidum]SDW79636.1 molybdenum cofactor synthesis domain-containing protein [Alicyclobacillus hesperidum]